MNNIIKEQFSEIQRHRKNLRDELEKSKSKGIYEILGDLYDDPAHFIYEIIQNADDEEAHKIKIDVSSNSVIICHNGKPFNIDDIESICAIGNSEKKNKIGRFGIGFKSVFAITDRPLVYSDEFDFAIENFIVPVQIDRDERYSRKKNETYIILPYSEDIKNIDKVIFDKVKNFEYREFIFLNNIIEIDISFNGEKAFYFKKSLKDTDIENCKEAIINERDRYLIFLDEENSFLKVAYKIDLDKNKEIILIPEYSDYQQKTKLNVFFPINYDTKLDFMMQGNFSISKDRKSINFDKDENKVLLEKLTDLVIKSINDLIKSNYENLIIYDVLPIKALEENKENYVYNMLIEKLHDLFNNYPVWLTDKKEYKNKDTILKSDSKKIKKLFEASFFGEKEYSWVSSIFQKGDRIKAFLEEYEIRKINFNDIKNMLTKKTSYIHGKDNDWLIEFYKYILADDNLIQQFSRLPIVKTRTNDFVSILNEKLEYNVFRKIDIEMNINVIKDYKINIMHEDFIEPLAEVLNKTDFIPVFNGYNVISNLLETNMKTDEDKLLLSKYFEVLNEILLFYKTIKDNRTLKRVHSLLNRKLPIASCINLKKFLIKGNREECYINNSDPDNNIDFYWADKDCINLFDNKSKIADKYYLGNYSFNNNSQNDSQYLVNSEAYYKSLQPENFKVFESILEKINIRNTILLTEEIKNVLDYKYELVENEKYFNDRLRPQDNSNYSHVFNPSILYINNILDGITPNNSKILWRIVCELFDKINFKTEGYFKYWYGSSNLTPVNTKLEVLEVLKRSKWLFDNYGNCKSAESLKYSDLNKSGYYLGKDKSEILKYVKVCRLLNISYGDELSNQEKKVYEIVDNFDTQQLDRLREYISKKIGK